MTPLARFPSQTGLGDNQQTQENTMSTTDLLFTVNEAAEVLRISRAYVYELASRGEIPAVRVGRRVLIPREALHQWVRDQVA